MLRKLVLGLALSSSLYGFLAEVRQGLETYDRRSEHRASPGLWRFGTAAVERLSTCLAEVRQVAPPGSFVAFVSPPGRGDVDFFRWRWAAYLLPEMEVLPIDSRETPQLAQYLIDYRRRFEHPRLGAMRQLRGCRLFEVRRP